MATNEPTGTVDENQPDPDERPQRRREYNGPASTLGVAAVIVVLVGLAIWHFEVRGDDGGVITGEKGFGITALAADQNPTGRAPAARAGRAAPNFRLPDLSGAPVQLTDYRGRWVLVNFWASWCAPCRSETPDLQAFAERHPEQVAVVGVNQQETAGVAADFVAQYLVRYPILLDRDGLVSQGYSIGRGLPISMLIDPDGVVVRVYIGRVTPEDLDAIASEHLT
jgi:thiol-disulfide isomerase/thioredoxin